MAGTAKKGDAKQTIALAMQEVQKFRAELARFFATLKPGDAMLQENINKLKELRDHVKEGERNVKHLTEANNALAGSQDKNAKSTHGFVSQLMQVELSIRRIQSGFDRMKKAAMFANDPARKWNDYRLMAEAVGETAKQLAAMDMSARKFNVSKGEISKWATDMKTELVGLSFGEYGGRLGKAMQRYGLNLSGHEDARGILAEVRRVALALPKNLQPLFMKDMGISANFHKWLTHGTDEEFFKNIKDNELAEEMLEKLNSKSEVITQQVGKNQVQSEQIDLKKVSEVSKPSEYANQLQSTLNNALLEHPTLIALKPLLEGVAGLGSGAFGSAGLINLLKTAGISASATGAGAAGAGAAAASSSALPAILVIAASLAVIAGGWYAVKAIGEHYQKVGTGKNEGESDAEFEKRVAEERKAYVEEREQQRLRMVANAASRGSLDDFDKDTKEHLKEFDADVATSRATIKKNNDLIAKQQAVIDRLKNHEIVPDSELAILSQLTGNQALNKTITDQLGGTRDLGVIKQNALARATTASKPDDFLAQQLSKYVQSKKLSDLTDVFKTENVGKLDNKQWEMFGQYIKSALSSEERMRLRSFVEDAPVGYAVPSNIRNKSSEITQDNTGHGFWWKFFHGGAAAQDGGMQILDAIEKEKEHGNGAKILQEIVDYSKKPTAEREAQRNRDMIEGLRRAQDAMKESARSLQSGGLNSPYLGKVEAASEEFKKPLAAIEVVNDAADEALLPGGAVNPQTVTNNDTSNIKKEMPITVSNNTEVKIVQNVGSASEAGEAFSSVQEKVNAVNMSDISNMIAQKIQLQLDDVGVAYSPVC